MFYVFSKGRLYDTLNKILLGSTGSKGVLPSLQQYARLSSGFTKAKTLTDFTEAR